jgi:xylan 1,4-beta-xylosidase
MLAPADDGTACAELPGPSSRQATEQQDDGLAAPTFSMTQFDCSLGVPGLPLAHVWSHTIGSGRAHLALRADWQAQMRRVRAELGCRHVRFHAILSDDMGTVLIEQGQLLYGFHNADLIFDFLVSIGMRPFVELSFMPTALASGEKTVFSFRGDITPPRDYAQWATLIQTLVDHWVARYGADEVRQWFFEVWNEPNLSAFWTGGQDGYFTLYRATVKAIKAVNADLQVGGPASAGDGWIRDFVDFCEREALPADFISTHHYPTDALGKPGDDTEKQLSLATRDILRTHTRATVEAARGKPVYYTEWSSSSNPFFHRHDEPYAAAFILKNFLDVADLVKGYSYWTFSDIFAENYFSSVPFHGGFGLLTIHGVAKPSYRAFQLLHRLGHERLVVTGAHETVDAWVVRDRPRLAVLLVNRAFPGHPIKTESVSVRLHGTAQPVVAWMERIDEDHCNPRRLWEALGSSPYPDPAELDALRAASELRREIFVVQAAGDGIVLRLDVPPDGIACITLEFAA